MYHLVGRVMMMKMGMAITKAVITKNMSTERRTSQILFCQIWSHLVSNSVGDSLRDSTKLRRMIQSKKRKRNNTSSLTMKICKILDKY